MSFQGMLSACTKSYHILLKGDKVQMLSLSYRTNHIGVRLCPVYNKHTINSVWIGVHCP